MRFPRLTVLVPLLATALVTPAVPHAGATVTLRVPAVTHASLAHKIAKVFRHKNGGKITYAVNDSGYGTINHSPASLSEPASNQKLFTTITLLDEVGADFRYATTVSATKHVRHHILGGDLVLRASGDPTLTHANLLQMATRLHRRGITRVTGHLIVDDTRYSHKTYVDGWKHKFIPEETGPIDAFTIDHNLWKRGRQFDANPTHANAKVFRHDLRHEHVRIGQRIQVGHAPPTPQLLLTHQSTTLGAIIDATLTDSINFDAEMMLREAGAQKYGHGSPKTGIEAEHAVAQKYGLAIGEVRDGSGLSYAELSSPAITMNWLLKLRSLPYFTTEYYALPLSCSTGTLKYRLCGRYVTHQVRAKTGTLNHASTLSGYVTAESGHVITFSFFASNVQSFAQVYTKVDKAVTILRRKG